MGAGGGIGSGRIWSGSGGVLERRLSLGSGLGFEERIDASIDGVRNPYSEQIAGGEGIGWKRGRGSAVTRFELPLLRLATKPQQQPDTEHESMAEPWRRLLRPIGIPR